MLFSITINIFQRRFISMHRGDVIAAKNTTPQLAVVIHTEEEFDWSGGFYRSNTRVTHGAELLDFVQRMLDLQVMVTLAMDHAFVSSEEGKDVIKKLSPKRNSEIEFASHLHPWVNPPFAGPDHCSVNESYPGNLPKDQEYAKLKVLTELIEAQCGERSVSYLAGRYGVGSNSYQILQSLGYTTDLSVTPLTSFADQQGPDFSHYNNLSYSHQGIRGIPHSTGLVSIVPWVARWFNQSPERYQHWLTSPVLSVLLKLLRVKKWRLSPEGFRANDMKKLCLALLDSGVTNFVFSFHSPSVKVGLTPYVSTQQELAQFENDCLQFLTWFKTSLNGRFLLAHQLSSCHS